MKTFGSRIRPGNRRRPDVILFLTIISLIMVSPRLLAVASLDVSQSITVKRTLTVDEANWGLVTLVDLTAGSEGSGTQALALRWGLGTGWFPTWSLELTSDVGLILQPGSTEAGSQVLRLSADGPILGHTYDVAMSYSPVLGALSLRVVDVTAHRVVYANTLEVAPFDQPLGSSLGQVHDGYVPYGSTWSFGSDTGGVFLTLRVLQADEAGVGIRLTTPPPYPTGTYRIWIEDREGARLYASLVPQATTSWVPLDVTELPYGRFTVRVDYEEDGRVLMQDSVTVTRGRFLVLLDSISVDADTGEFSGHYRLQSDRPLPALELRMDAELVPLLWDAATKRYVEAGEPILARLTNASVQVGHNTTIPFHGRIPFTDEYPTWRIDFNISAEPDVLLDVNGASQVVHFGPEPDLKVMSFNIRYPASSDGENVWNNRRELTTRVILDYAPDIMGLQEPWDIQLAYLDRALEGYARVSMRPDPSKGEHNAIYYNTRRLDLVDWGTFWLSATPDVRYSATWGNSIIRGAIWARLRMRDSGQEVVVFNTHFHHTGDADTMRTRSAELLLDRVKALAGDDPVVVLGDFNATTGSRAYAVLTQENEVLYDARSAAAIQRGPAGTTHGFTGVVGVDRIDWILLGGGLQVLDSEHIVAQEGPMFPSDHVPVTTGVYLPE